jgi:hypothetical protein
VTVVTDRRTLHRLVDAGVAALLVTLRFVDCGVDVRVGR